MNGFLTLQEGSSSDHRSLLFFEPLAGLIFCRYTAGVAVLWRMSIFDHNTAVTVGQENDATEWEPQGKGEGRKERGDKKSHSISFSVLEKGPKMLLLKYILNDCNNRKKPLLMVEIIGLWKVIMVCDINRTQYVPETTHICKFLVLTRKMRPSQCTSTFSSTAGWEMRGRVAPFSRIVSSYSTAP